MTSPSASHSHPSPSESSSSSLHDASMAFHDANALPFPSFPRPSSPLQTFITHLVLAQDVSHAASHLSSLALRDPSSIPLIVNSLRKHFFPLFPLPPSPQIPHLLHVLVLSVPYFYRYIASPHFARGLRRLATSSSPTPAAAHARLLLAGWARDLAPHARAHDPAAMLWVSAYRRAKRASDHPFPTPPPRRFVCSVPLPDAALPHELNPGHRMDAADVAATLRLLEQVVLAAKRKERKSSAGEKRDSARRKRPPRGPSGGGVVRVNEKLMNVLRRNEDLFAGEVFAGEELGFEDSAITLRVGSEKGGSSGALSVAEVAKINARRKLSESQRSLSVSWVGRSEEGTFDRLEVEAEEAGVEKAITPSTFADIGIGAGRAAERFETEGQKTGTTGSVGDTVNLDGLELGSEDGNTSVEQKILKFMAAAIAKEEQTDVEVDSRNATQGRSGEPEGVRISFGKVC